MTGTTATPDEGKNETPKDQKKQSTHELRDDETLVSGNTTTTMGTNFAQWQEEMMRTMRATFQTFATTVTEAQAEIHREQAAAQARVNSANIANQDRVNQLFLERLEASERNTRKLTDQISEITRRNEESDKRAREMNLILNSTAGAVTSIHTREERSRILQYHKAQRVLAAQANTTPPPPLRVPPAIYNPRTRRMMTYDDIGRPTEENMEIPDNPERTPTTSPTPMEEDRSTTRKSSLAAVADTNSEEKESTTHQQDKPPPAEAMDEDKPAARKSSLAVAATAQRSETPPNTSAATDSTTTVNRNTTSGRLSSLATAVTGTFSSLDTAMMETVSAYRRSGAANNSLSRAIISQTQRIVEHRQSMATEPRTTTLQEAVSETAASLIANRERLARRPTQQGATTPSRISNRRAPTTPSTLESLENSDEETQYTDDKVKATAMQSEEETSYENIDDDETRYGNIDGEEDQNWGFDDDENDDEEEADENSVVKNSDFDPETEDEEMEDEKEIDDKPVPQYDASDWAVGYIGGQTRDRR
jgi:hypothetical protein